MVRLNFLIYQAQSPKSNNQKNWPRLYLKSHRNADSLVLQPYPISKYEDGEHLALMIVPVEILGIESIRAIEDSDIDLLGMGKDWRGLGTGTLLTHGPNNRKRIIIGRIRTDMRLRDRDNSNRFDDGLLWPKSTPNRRQNYR